MMHYMSMKTNEDDSLIPKGMAMLFLSNSGQVGTNNGFPASGQPALFPKSQAHAILTVWSYIQNYHPELDEMPHPECIPEEVKRWINGFVAG